MTIQIAALRAGPLPAVYGLDAATILAVPLALFVWFAANVALRRTSAP
jgi:hypothetical protein